MMGQTSKRILTMRLSYRATINACFIGYIVQAKERLMRSFLFVRKRMPLSARQRHISYNPQAR